MPRTLSPGKLPNRMLNSLLKQLPHHDSEVVIPAKIGIDAAGLKLGDRLLAVATDPITFATKSLGKYAVRVNVNDIACLGCAPKWFSSVIMLPPGAEESFVYDMWYELNDELAEFNIELIGGHTEVTSAVTKPIIVGQLIGEAVNKRFFDPREIKAVNKILLWRGAAVEGTALLAAERFDELSQHIIPAQLETMVSLLDEPGICIWPAAKALFDLEGVVALHDPTEGGVATALHELADLTGCGLQIQEEFIPILSETRQLAMVLGFDPLGLLASGSLLIVCHSGAEAEILSRLQGERVAVIGEFTESVNRVLNRQGGAGELPRYDQDELVRALSVAI